MEMFSALRCLPRRSVLCFAIVCVMFFACAFYTFFDSGNQLSTLSYVDEIEIHDEVESKPPNPMLVHSFKFQDRISDLEMTNSMHESESTSASNNSKILKVLSNTSNNGKPKHAGSVQTPTKYIYLNSSVSTSKPLSVPTSTSSPGHSTTTSSPDTCHLTMEDHKLILLWTPFFDYWEYLPQQSFRHCSRCRNCKVTTDRSKLLESDAVIFHARDMSVIDMPPLRLPHQRWIFYCLESPSYSDFPGLQHTQNMFNWTMTYRADSDIFAPYGAFSKIRPSRKLDMQSLEWAWSNKSKTAVWMSSHCPTYGGRDLFVTELRKYIDVDVYGDCGTSICPRGETEKCLQEFAFKYKFFFAFENSICKDYITEKFYRTLEYNIIPVVFGGGNYDKFAPPGSFVDALSFKSPKHLAFFLTGVGKNFKLYSSFFQWRKNYSIKIANAKECKLCSMLHRKDLMPSSYENLREWWVKDSHCKTWKPKR